MFSFDESFYTCGERYGDMTLALRGKVCSSVTAIFFPAYRRCNFGERVLRSWRRREDCHNHQTIRSRILDRMHGARWSEGGIADIQQDSILTDANHAAAFENEIKLVLSAMGVSSVLLTRFERIQTNEKRFTLHDRALAHFVRCEPCKTDDPFCKHDLKCTGTL